MRIFTFIAVVCCILGMSNCTSMNSSDNRKMEDCLFLADSFRKVGVKDSALFYFKQAESLLADTASVSSRYHIYRSLGELNQETFNPVKAKEYYHRTLRLPSLNANDSIPILYHLLGIYYYEQKEDSMTWCYNSSPSSTFSTLDSIGKNYYFSLMFVYSNELWGFNWEATHEHAIRAMKCASWATAAADASMISRLQDKNGNLQITDSICTMVDTIEDLPRRANLNYLLYREATRYKMYPLATRLSRRYIADVDSFTTVYTENKLKDWEEKHAHSELQRTYAETRSRWYATILISVLAFILLGTTIILFLRWQRKRYQKEWQNHKAQVQLLQKRIDSMDEEMKRNMGQQEYTRQLQLEMDELKDKKRQSEIRIRQLETIYRVKGDALSTQDAEAFQVFRRIMDKHAYHPASERHLLQHWMNLSHRDFAIRLDIRCKDLSDREKDICYLVALGLEFDHIAETLDIQPRSVDRYISTICKKLEFEKGNKKLFAEFMAGWR